MLYFEPFDAVDSEPKVQAHLSAFSEPRVSYHAFRSGSLVASSSSCASTLAMPSAPASPFGLVVCAMQPLGHCVAASPTNAYLISWPRIVPWVCQPQYCEQKPELAVTSGPVNTKYTPFVSLGFVS